MAMRIHLDMNRERLIRSLLLIWALVTLARALIVLVGR